MEVEVEICSVELSRKVIARLACPLWEGRGSRAILLLPDACHSIVHSLPSRESEHASHGKFGSVCRFAGRDRKPTCESRGATRFRDEMASRETDQARDKRSRLNELHGESRRCRRLISPVEA